MKFHFHAVARMGEEGATEEEVAAAVAEGEQFPAKFGRSGFRRILFSTACGEGSNTI